MSSPPKTPAATTISPRMDKVRALHASVIKGVDSVHDQTARILAEQEKDLLRAFRSRLTTVQGDLEAQRERADTGVVEYIKRVNNLEKQVEELRDQLDRTERMATALGKENVRLKAQCKKMEEDRELLVKQVIESRGLTASAQESKAIIEQTCASLSAELEDIRNQQQQDRINRLEAAERATKAASTSSASSSPIKGHLETSSSSSSSSSSFAAFGMSEDEALRMADGILLGSEPAAQGGNKNQTLSGLNILDETRYRDLIARLKRMLDAEKRVSRLARSQLAADLESRSEVEVFLRKAIEETRNEIAKKREALMIAAGQGDRVADKSLKAIPIGLSKHDREILLSQLLQQDLVILSLPNIVFPSRAGSHSGVDGGNGGSIGGGKEGEAHKEGGHGSLKRSTSTPH
jgi:hypothetical protein